MKQWFQHTCIRILRMHAYIQNLLHKCSTWMHCTHASNTDTVVSLPHTQTTRQTGLSLAMPLSCVSDKTTLPRPPPASLPVYSWGKGKLSVSFSTGLSSLSKIMSWLFWEKRFLPCWHHSYLDSPPLMVINAAEVKVCQTFGLKHEKWSRYKMSYCINSHYDMMWLFICQLKCLCMLFGLPSSLSESFSVNYVRENSL